MDEKTRSPHGIFISYKRSHKHLAGRIFDYFNYKGMAPFIDEHSLHQSPSFWKDIEKEIQSSPYFLLLLTKDGLEDLLSENHQKMALFFEVKTAFENNKHIRILSYGDVDLEKLNHLPKEIQSLKDITVYKIPQDSRFFFPLMDELYQKDFDPKEIVERIGWNQAIKGRVNTFIVDRAELEKNYASFNHRFGKEFMLNLLESNKNEEKRIKEINLVCYAATVIFTPNRSLIDRKAFDYGTMFNVFKKLLEDDDFYLRIVTVAPFSNSVEDAIEYERLGNSALMDEEQLVFLSSYAGVQQLREDEPFKTAWAQRHFLYYVTECALPYAIFQVIYKDPWKELNHVKVDLYSVGMDSSMDRRTMIFFEHNPAQKADYDFFVQQFQYLFKDARKRSKNLISKNHEEWMKKWEEMKVWIEE